jgi:peroxiredoxin Q/BCP
MALQAGTTAPDFTLNSHDGKPVSLASLRGKKVVVAFMPFAFTGG